MNEACWQIFRWPPSLRDHIERHCIANDDWNATTLFEKVGAFKSTDTRFVRFIEALASSSVRPDEAAQRAFMDALDEVLKPYGVHFIATIGADTYLEGQLTYLGGTTKASPKNLIFASKAKPDLRFSNALDNDVEVVSGGNFMICISAVLPGRCGAGLRMGFGWGLGFCLGSGGDDGRGE